MGTNYYATVTETDELVHLGKRSAGWVFLFRTSDHFRTTSELIGWLETTPVTIHDEYGETKNIVEWIRMALGWGQPDGNRPEGAHRNIGCPCPRDHRSPWPRIEASYYSDGPHEWTTLEFS